jgi:DNA polymerase-1
MTILTSDFETTTSNKGNPFDVKNKAVCIGYKKDANTTECDFLCSPNFVLSDFSLCVFFNAKFDLHWYRRLGYSLDNIKVWCCQLAEFLLEKQTNPYPSLEQAAVKYSSGHKIDIIKTEYWEKDIDTSYIPQDILSSYVIQDVDLTYQIYLKQLEQFQKNPTLFKLFKLQCQDLLVLEEMEWNGLLYNEDLCTERSKECQEEIANIRSTLSAYYPDIPINFGSGYQLSAFLYGGNIPYTVSEHVGFYKNGNPKYKKVDKVHVLPRLIEPLRKSNLDKEGYYATDEGTLNKLKGKYVKELVKPLLRLAHLDKLDGTYYRGVVKINNTMHWPKNEIHSNFNQCVTTSGRLSSSKPNVQNLSGDCADVFISRY